MLRQTPIQAARTLRLADVVESASKKVFNFAYIVKGAAPEKMLSEPNECGTTACAFGFGPLAFPNDLTWQDGNVAAIGGAPWKGMAFFANPMDFRRLFLPGPVELGDSGLPETASAKEVAAHMRQLVYEQYPDLKPTRGES